MGDPPANKLLGSTGVTVPVSDEKVLWEAISVVEAPSGDVIVAAAPCEVVTETLPSDATCTSKEVAAQPEETLQATLVAINARKMIFFMDFYPLVWAVNSCPEPGPWECRFPL